MDATKPVSLVTFCVKTQTTPVFVYFYITFWYDIVSYWCGLCLPVGGRKKYRKYWERGPVQGLHVEKIDLSGITSD